MTTTIEVPMAQKAATFEANLERLMVHMYVPFSGLLAAFSPDATIIHVVAEDMTELLRRLSVHKIPTESVVIQRVPGERPPADNPWPGFDFDFAAFAANQQLVPLEYLRLYCGKQVAWHRDGTRIVAAGDTDDELVAQLRELGVDPLSVVYDTIGMD